MIYYPHDNQVIEMTPDWVEYIYSNYVPDGSLISLYGPPDLDRLEVPKDVSCIITDASVYTNIEQELQRNGLKGVDHILTGLYKYYKTTMPDPRMQFFPFWAIYMSSVNRLSEMSKDFKFSTEPKTYKLSCLN